MFRWDPIYPTKHLDRAPRRTVAATGSSATAASASTTTWSATTSTTAATGRTRGTRSSAHVSGSDVASL